MHSVGNNLDLEHDEILSNACTDTHTNTVLHEERSVDKVHPPRYVTFSVCCGFYWRKCVESVMLGQNIPEDEVSGGSDTHQVGPQEST